ncbi:hypothetical protein [Arthrobacter rhizosphaerae]|uniref:hypothetical protein n=1 Tax=Arthrobacter rhizosphaerae TaxID=2855490 RepID=UPI001FF3CC7C|nr:hypothetical protein [Arthrobacter rhizosphaerae]
MKDQSQRQDSFTASAATGHHAPISGWWRPEDDPQPFRYVQRGEIMPALDGSQTRWTLVQQLEPLDRVRTLASQGQAIARAL